MVKETSTVVTAALLVIGNEILSGRTQDKNIGFLGRELNEIGIQLREVRIVADIEAEIIAAVNALRARYAYVFTTGGIGPTHDDITSESVSRAFGLEAGHHPEAYRRMADYYRETGREFTDARKRMALTAPGAELIDNEVSIAPGWRYENVFVMAGVPQIMQAMFRAAIPRLAGGAKVLSRSIETNLAEGTLAEALGNLQTAHPAVDIGSYPTYDPAVGPRVSLVVRGPDVTDVDAATARIIEMINELGGQVLSKPA